MNCCNFGRSSFQTHVVPFLLSFFTLFDFFLTLHLLLGATTKGWKESIGFSDSELYAESFEEKKFINKIKYSRSSQDLDFFGVSISSHVVYFRFLSTSRHFGTTQENQNRSIRSRRISCNWGENFRLSQKERF